MLEPPDATLPSRLKHSCLESANPKRLAYARAAPARLPLRAAHHRTYLMFSKP